MPQALALRAGLELGIFTRLGEGALTAGELAGKLDVAADRLSRLLYALASIGLLEVEDGAFRNGLEAATFLDAARPTFRGGDHAVTLMELPTVAAVAPEILSDYGLDDVIVEEGDITLARSTGRHDLAILKAVVQVLPPAQASSAILNAARCLKPGGEIAIAGWGVDHDRLGPTEGVPLNLTFLNLYRSGESYTEASIAPG